MSPSILILLYGLSTASAFVLFLIAWRSERHASLVQILAMTLPLLIGFCALEERWPWQMHSPWRRHYWIPVGLLVMAVLVALAKPLRLRELLLLGIGSIITAALIVYRYAFQWMPDWSDGQSLVLLVGLLLLASLAVLGQVKLAQALSEPWFLVHTGAFLSVAIAYGIVGASSLKVGQWISIFGCVSAVMFVFTLLPRPLKAAPEAAAIGMWFTAASMLYGLYAGEGALLLPMLAVLSTPLSGLLWWKWKPHRFGRVALGWFLICVGLAIGMYFMNRPSQDEEDDLDAYGLVSPWIGDSLRREA